VLYTTSCKHSLALLRMGEIIARNMFSWFKLLIKLSLLHLVGCLYSYINDARSLKHQMIEYIQEMTIRGMRHTTHKQQLKKNAFRICVQCKDCAPCHYLPIPDNVWSCGMFLTRNLRLQIQYLVCDVCRFLCLCVLCAWRLCTSSILQPCWSLSLNGSFHV